MRNGLLFFLPLVFSYAQNGDSWKALQGKYPADASPQIQLVDPHTYRQGELIRAQVTHVRPEPGGPPPTERWNIAGLLLDPPVECGTVAKPCGLGRAPMVSMGLFHTSDPDFLALNHFLPDGLTGRYRIALLSTRSVRVNQGAMDTVFVPSNGAYALSNAVEIEVTVASPEWMQQTIAKSRAVLAGPPPRDAEAHAARWMAAQQLAVLNGPEAWNAALDLVAQDENTLLSGVAAGMPAKDVCDLMLARVSSPTQSVSGAYLWKIAEVCARANLPPAPALPAGTRPQLVLRAQISMTPLPAVAPAYQPPPEVRDWSAKYNSYTGEIRAKAAASLASSLQQKEVAVRATALTTLVEYIRQARTDHPNDPDPSWTSLLSADFAREFRQANSDQKVQLLLLYSSIMDTPDMIPMAEVLLDTWKPGDSYEGPHTALRVLQSVAPEQARKRILAELTKSNSWLDATSLDLLPPSAVPAMDDALIDAWSRELRPGGWPSQVHTTAIAKYATPQALPRIKGIFESQGNQCQPEVVAYFVRVDPAYAEQIFHSHAWDMQARPPMCMVQYFIRTSQLAMAPPLEAYLSAYLMSGDIYVKTTAAQSLGLYGSPAVLPKLWDTLRYFHEYWKGKEAELNANGQGVALEVALRNAIARGRRWLATDAEFREIQSLCSSRQCMDETRNDLARWTDPFAIEIIDQPIGVRMRIAQYELDSVDALKTKLEQFPKGSRFAMTTWGSHAAKIGAAIRQFAAENGFTIAP